MKIKLKKCLDCESDITEAHFNRKRCNSCASLSAIKQSRKSISKWKANNKAAVIALNKAWDLRFPLKKRYNHAKGIAKSRGYGCSISKDQFIELWSSPCEYCGKSILNDKGIGLDRLNNKDGYHLTNVVPCCGDCNYIRGDILTYDEMKIAMTAVVEFRKLQGET